jgi:gas vesicle protein
MIQEIIETLNGTTQRRARRNTAIGVSVGVLVGAIAGLLLAPKSGKETRADIVKGVKAGEETIKDVAHHVAAVAKEKVEAIKTKMKKETQEDEETCSEEADKEEQK